MIWGSISLGYADRRFPRPRSTSCCTAHRVPWLSHRRGETLVTQPIETALLGASGVQASAAKRRPLNVIYVEFDWRTDIRAAHGRRSRTIDLALRKPPEGIRPQMTPPASIMGQIVMQDSIDKKGPMEAPSFLSTRTIHARVPLRTFKAWKNSMSGSANRVTIPSNGSQSSLNWKISFVENQGTSSIPLERSAFDRE